MTRKSTTKSYHSEDPTQCEDCLRWRPRRLIWTFSVGVGKDMRTVHAHCKSCDGWCEDHADDTPDECIGTYDSELTAAELRELAG